MNNKATKKQKKNASKACPKATQRRPRKTPTMRTVPVSVQKNLRRTPADSGIHVHRGTDRIIGPLKISDYHPGDVIVNELITPEITKRLSSLSKTFQKIKYMSLRFRICGESSSLAGGGFVAAFVRDPADSLPDTDKVKYLITNSGARVTRWWNSTIVTAPRLRRDWLYTEKPDLGADSLRTYSPGRLLVLCDGATTQEGTISVDLDWTIHLKDATDRPAPEPESSALLPSTYLSELVKSYRVQGWLTTNMQLSTAAGALACISNGVNLVLPTSFSSVFGFELQSGDVIKVEGMNHPSVVQRNDYQHTVMCSYLKLQSGRITLAAMNPCTQTVLVPDKSWVEYSDSGSLISPYLNDHPMCGSYDLPVGTKLTLCKPDGTPIPLQVAKFYRPVVLTPGN